jgi:hypothetical protein
MESNPKQTKFIFCHTPKVAGTTMGKILHRNFGKRFYMYYGLWDNRFFTAEDIEGMCTLHPQYTCLASHMFSLDLPFYSERFDYKAIAFVRDPVDRALSLYFYSFRMAKENPGYEPPGPIDSFFENIFQTRCDQRFFNAQFNFLAGGKPESLSFSKIEELVRSGKLILAPMERFDDTCLLLEQLYPDVFKNAASPGKRNESSWNQKISLELRNRLLQENATDSELFTLSKRLFDQSFFSVFLDHDFLQKKRASFRRRCWLERKMSQIKKILHSSYRKSGE